MKKNIVQYLLVVLVVIGAYMVGVYKTKVDYLENGGTGQVGQGQNQQAPGSAPEQKTVLSDEEWRKAQEGAAYTSGKDNAPVTIVEFTDYQCPFCEKYFTETYAQIKKNYIETGKVRYMTRDLPLPFHANAEKAAVAARCAGKQNAYQAMHDKLFETQQVWSALTDVNETFIGYTGSLGIKKESFRSCLADQSVLSAVKADAALASELGANGTPTFMINGNLLVGAQPYSAFQTMIDGEL